jgi:hypothetical protein
LLQFRRKPQDRIIVKGSLHQAARLLTPFIAEHFGIQWRWMAFIDIDEFLFPAEGNSLPATLADYESLPAVAAYWPIYGFNGHKSRPSGLTIENYTKPAAHGFPVRPKSIVDPSKVIGIESVHLFNFPEGHQIAYDEQKRLLRPGGRGSSSNILRLNHYVTRSREEFAAKLAKWDRVDVDCRCQSHQNQHWRTSA